MRNGLDAWTQSAEVLMDYRNIMLGAPNVSLSRFFKLKYYGTFTHNAQYVNSNPRLKLIKGIFSNKPIVFILLLQLDFPSRSLGC